MVAVKNNVPVFALAISFLGTITNFVTEAKSLVGLFAAIASLIASLYAVALTRERLKKLRGRSHRSLRSKLKKLFRGSSARAARTSMALWLIPLLCFTGCATNDSNSTSNIFKNIAKFPARILDKTAELVTATTTNVIEHAVITATETVTQDPFTLLLATNTMFQTNVTLVTNITAVPRGAIAKGIDAAETASTFLPPPYGEAAAGALALITAGLAAAVRRRNAMLKTVIQGVEGSANKEVKETIAGTSRLNGTAEELHKLVKQITTR